MSGSQNVMFMSFVFIIGFILLIISQAIDNNISDKCKDNTIRVCNKAIYTIGILFIVLPFTFLLCGKEVSESYKNTQLGFFLLLGFLLIILGSIIMSKATGDCEDSKRHGGAILGIGITFFVLVSIYLGLTKTSQGKSLQEKSGLNL